MKPKEISGEDMLKLQTVMNNKELEEVEKRIIDNNNLFIIFIASNAKPSVNSVAIIEP